MFWDAESSPLLHLGACYGDGFGLQKCILKRQESKEGRKKGRRERSRKEERKEGGREEAGRARKNMY